MSDRTIPPVSWQPACPQTALKARAELLTYVREFFRLREVLEVETPILAPFGVTDSNVEGVSADWPLEGAGQPRRGFLQTSPEYHMKRLLAAGSGSIFQIFRAFRAGERGRRHNPEFSLLEWYRIDFDHQDLMDEVAELVCGYLECPVPVRLSYRQLFSDYLGLDPFLCSDAALATAVANETDLAPAGLGRDQALDALISLAIEPRLRQAPPTFVYGFPASQAALARTESHEGITQAHRFELYVQGIELCNGYWELSDVVEQQRRFAADNETRRQAGLEERLADPMVLAALAAGLPDCAGVALGLDRLLMLRLGAASLDEVLAFPLERT